MVEISYIRSSLINHLTIKNITIMTDFLISYFGDKTDIVLVIIGLISYLGIRRGFSILDFEEDNRYISISIAVVAFWAIIFVGSLVILVDYLFKS